MIHNNRISKHYLQGKKAFKIQLTPGAGVIDEPEDIPCNQLKIRTKQTINQIKSIKCKISDYEQFK